MFFLVFTQPHIFNFRRSYSFNKKKTESFDYKYVYIYINIQSPKHNAVG